MTTESNEQYRAGFEAWARDKRYDLTKCEEGSRIGPAGSYKNTTTAHAWDVWTASKREASTEPIPDVLFDGHAVYKEVLTDSPNPPRTSPDNVAEVLDAVVRLMRKAGSGGTALPASGAGIEQRKLEAARQWIDKAPHGDNCFLHDEGEYDRCFCGKDALVAYLESDEAGAGSLPDEAK